LSRSAITGQIYDNFARDSALPSYVYLRQQCILTL
jgi:hypothetical protein